MLARGCLTMVASICTSMQEVHRKIVSVSMSAPHVGSLASNVVSNLRSLSDANVAMMKSTFCSHPSPSRPLPATINRNMVPNTGQTPPHPRHTRYKWPYCYWFHCRTLGLLATGCSTPLSVTMFANVSLPARHSLLALARICLAFLWPGSCILCHWLVWFMSYLTSVQCYSAYSHQRYQLFGPSSLRMFDRLLLYSIQEGSLTYLFIHEFAHRRLSSFCLFLSCSAALWFPVSSFHFTTWPLARPPSICSVFFSWLLGFPAWWIFYCSGCFSCDVFRIFILLIFYSSHSISLSSPKLSSARLSHLYYCHCPIFTIFIFLVLSVLLFPLIFAWFVQHVIWLLLFLVHCTVFPSRLNSSLHDHHISIIVTKRHLFSFAMSAFLCTILVHSFLVSSLPSPRSVLLCWYLFLLLLWSLFPFVRFHRDWSARTPQQQQQ